jgi:hypothetical protein
MGKKFKSLVADERSFLAILVILVALASFALGRHSTMPVGSLWGQAAGKGAPAAVSMAYTEVSPKAEEVRIVDANPRVAIPREPEAMPTASGPFVASKSGTKYHHESCGGAKQIKPENKLYFSTEAEARAAGYTPAANCKILNP